MIELHSWPTPNGLKVSIMLEETGLAHQVFPVNIGSGQQFLPEFLEISPNNRIPAIIDRDPSGGGLPISLFESGAILLYLAEKTGKFLSSDLRERQMVLQWLFWQVGGLGPMHGQYGHFHVYAPDKISYAMERYSNETRRLYRVLDTRLQDRDYIAGEYSIADMACYPWINPYEKAPIAMDDFPNLQAWHNRVKDRPAVIKAYASRKELYGDRQEMTDQERKILFGQTGKN